MEQVVVLLTALVFLFFGYKKIQSAYNLQVLGIEKPTKNLEDFELLNRYRMIPQKSKERVACILEQEYKLFTKKAV